MAKRPVLYQKAIGTDGPVLVFLPGVGGTTRYWERRIAPLASAPRLLLVDLLGYGRSSKPWTTYSVERHVAELHRVLAAHEQLTLIGHSFGAIVAVAYAARYPQQVGRLVLLSLPYWGSEDTAKRYFRRHATLESWFMTNIVLAAVACIITRRLLRHVLPRMMPDLPREIAEDLALHTWRSSTSTIWDGIYRYDLADDARRLPSDVPVLLLHGDHDTTAPLDGARRLAAQHPYHRLIVLPGVDHHPLLRDPEGCVDAIRAFVMDSAQPLPQPSSLQPIMSDVSSRTLAAP